jgi:hypothetical protein
MSDDLSAEYLRRAVLRAIAGEPSALVEACTGPSSNDLTVPNPEDIQAAAELRQAGRLN